MSVGQIGSARHTEKHREKTKLQISLSRRDKGIGKSNPNWKGGVDTYGSLHDWVEVRLGKPRKCEFCSSTNQRFYDWANKSHQYKRDLSDWIRLCRPCHKKYDTSN